MPQNQRTGAEANRWGRATARRVAEALDATDFGGRSNECTVGAQRVVIKCARRRTSSVGVVYHMLKRLDAVIGAFELDSGEFELWSLTPQQYRKAMRATASKGASAGRVGMVNKSYFETHGRRLRRLTL